MPFWGFFGLKAMLLGDNVQESKLIPFTAISYLRASFHVETIHRLTVHVLLLTASKSTGEVVNARLMCQHWYWNSRNIRDLSHTIFAPRHRTWYSSDSFRHPYMPQLNGPSLGIRYGSLRHDYVWQSGARACVRACVWHLLTWCVFRAHTKEKTRRSTGPS